MAYKCRICGSNEVDNPGDVCELCAIGMDPYATGLGGMQSQQNHATRNVVDAASHSGSGYVPKRSGNRRVLIQGGASMANTDPYGNDMTVSQNNSQVQVYSAGQVPVQTVTQSTESAEEPKRKGNQPEATGITKNITVDTQKVSVLEKWFRCLFQGIPYTLDDDVTMFQVFPDYTGTSLNARGNACDQIIVYGKLNNGEISENNEVEVYGHRDSRNNVIATTIKNKASGTIVKAQRVVPAGFIRFMTLLALLLILGMALGLGTEGIIWAVVIILCLTNLPLVFKILGGILAMIFSFNKRR